MGGIGLCFGNEQSRHFGVTFLGYESCCRNKNAIADSTYSNNSQSITHNCNCTDEILKANNVSQDISSKHSLDGIFNHINTVNTQIVAYYINFNNIEHEIPINTKPRIRDNCLSKLNTEILII